jgi:hypothetical protein
MFGPQELSKTRTPGRLFGPTKYEREEPAMDKRVLKMTFASVYPYYVQKAERKGRTKEEVDEIILWLTGHSAKSFQKAMDDGIDLATFHVKAPRFQPKAKLITGVVCGVRVEDLKDKTERRIRYLDKLIDELANGKAMEKILRQ